MGGRHHLAASLESIVTVERVAIRAGSRFGPYGKGVNPFKKRCPDLQKLKENPHGVFLGEPRKHLSRRLFTEDKKINLAPEVMLNDIPRLRALGSSREAKSAERRVLSST